MQQNFIHTLDYPICSGNYVRISNLAVELLVTEASCIHHKGMKLIWGRMMLS